MLIAHLTDPHVRAGREHNQTVKAAIAALNAMTPSPAALMITGDLTVGGAADEYAELAAILAELRIPWYVTIGNHDVRAQFLQAPGFEAFRDEAGFVQHAVEDFPVRILMLDSTSDAHHSGEFCAQRRQWLADRLCESSKPTLLGLHHPPFRTGIVAMDGKGPGWARGLIDEVSRHRHVIGMLCGHVHRSIQAVVAGVLVSACPSPLTQVILDLDPNSSLEKLLSVGFSAHEPPAMQFALWTGENLVTHGAFIEQYRRNPGVDIHAHPEMSQGRYQGKLLAGPPV